MCVCVKPPGICAIVCVCMCLLGRAPVRDREMGGVGGDGEGRSVFARKRAICAQMTARLRIDDHHTHTHTYTHTHTPRRFDQSRRKEAKGTNQTPTLDGRSTWWLGAYTCSRVCAPVACQSIRADWHVCMHTCMQTDRQADMAVGSKP